MREKGEPTTMRDTDKEGRGLQEKVSAKKRILGGKKKVIQREKNLRKILSR